MKKAAQKLNTQVQGKALPKRKKISFRTDKTNSIGSSIVHWKARITNILTNLSDTVESQQNNLHKLELRIMN